MIGRLSGRLDYRGQDHVLIDVQGVGYIVFCSDRTLAGLPTIGQPVRLYTDLLVREDVLQLFGFATLAEKEWHRLLMSVQSVGAKASLSILGALGPDGLSRAIALGDWASVKVAKGVGPKTAQRVVLDLKDKAPVLMSLVEAPAPAATEMAAPEAPHPTPAAAPLPPPTATAQADALSALSNLGYAPGEAAAAVAETLAETPDLDAAGLIRLSLRRLAPAE